MKKKTKTGTTKNTSVKGTDTNSHRRKGSRFTLLSKGKTKKRGQMNKTEKEYAVLLDAQMQAGEILDYWFEPVSLRLSQPDKGVGARYTPDFMVLFPSGDTVMVDVKGGNFPDPAAIVRIKCAAEQYPLWTFQLAVKQAKKNGGGFKIRNL